MYLKTIIKVLLISSTLYNACKFNVINYYKITFVQRGSTRTDHNCCDSRSQGAFPGTSKRRHRHADILRYVCIRSIRCGLLKYAWMTIDLPIQCSLLNFNAQLD